MAFLKSIWKNNSKHKKLSEELALQIKDNETENEIEITENADSNIVTFKLKYLGSTVVEKITGDSISVEAVKNIIKVAKASRKKLQRVNLAISLKGITVTDLQGNELIQISIYRISNCSTDASHRQVFSFISTDTNETMECHGFLCSKRKLAETVTLAVAHAFSTAYEAWRILPSTKEFEQKAVETENMKNSLGVNALSVSKNVSVVEDGFLPVSNGFSPVSNSFSSVSYSPVKDVSAPIAISSRKYEGASEETEEKLIDFDDEKTTQMNVSTSLPAYLPSPRRLENNCNQWVSFEDDFGHEPDIWNSSNKPGGILA